MGSATALWRIVAFYAPPSTLGGVVAATLRRLLQAVRFEREAFVWMDFEDRATADAFLLVLVTRVVMMLGFGARLFGTLSSISGIELLISSLINAAIFWLAYAGLVYAVTRFLLNGETSYATVLRIVGFAYPTLLLLIFTVRIVDTPTVAFILGSLWFLAIVAQGLRHVSNLDLQRAAIAAGGGLVAWIVVASIFGRGLI